MMLLIILVFHAVANYCVHSNELTSVIQTDKGPVQGEILKTVRSSIPFSSFRGIRYGKAPTGYLRFKPPQDAESWSETFHAIADGNPCPQYDPFQNKMFVNEDCLNLNVYSPKTNFNSTTEKPFPVMVYFYGGSFKFGNTNMKMYGPDFFIENEVVVVIMNYRLGILGFLSLNLTGATGNAGLKDQQLALKWVQRNIKAFGGDPHRVTIFGNSVGAASTDYHVVADGSKGLFHRTISMSGSSLCSWALSSASEAEERAFRLGSLVGINATNKIQLLEELYKQSAYDLVVAGTAITIVDPTFKATLEDPKIAGNTAFLTECSLKKYKAGKISHVPSMTGFLPDEGLEFFTNVATVKDAVNVAINQLQVLNDDSVLTALLHSYSIQLDSVTSLDDLDNKTLRDLITVLSDVIFIAGIDTNQRISARYRGAPVYYYRLSFAPYASIHRFQSGINITGTAHGDDLAYCWYIPIWNFPTNPDDPFVITRDRITRMWTNFAKHSNPTPIGKHDPLLNISWPVSGLSGEHLEISNELSIGKRLIDQFTVLAEDISEPSLEIRDGCH